MGASPITWAFMAWDPVFGCDRCRFRAWGKKELRISWLVPKIETSRAGWTVQEKGCCIGFYGSSHREEDSAWPHGRGVHG